MPAINPLLYDENTEAETLATEGVQQIRPASWGAIHQTFEAFGTATGNKTVAIWNDIKESARAQSRVPGLEVAEPEWMQPTKIREVDPRVTSTAAKTVGSIGADVLTMGLGLPFAAYAATSETQQETNQQLQESGVDKSTALKVSYEKAGETALGWSLNAIPGAKYLSKLLPNRWMQLGAKAAIGGTLVTGIDAAGGESRAQILENHGYDKQAAQMRHWDAMRLTTDIIGGAMLAIGGEGGTKRAADVPDNLGAAAQHIEEVDHLIHESAPGLPTTPEASAATSNATLKAINDIENGQPVNVADIEGIHDATFIAPDAPTVEAAQRNIDLYEKALVDLRQQRDDAASFIERARRDGYHEEADHYAENVLPGKNNIVHQYESLLDQAKDDLHRANNPGAPSRALEEIRPALDEHAQIRTEMFDKAQTFDSAIRDDVQTGQSAAPDFDVYSDARTMLEQARNPIPEGGAAPAQPKAPKLTPTQQDFVNRHADLRRFADESGDTGLHDELNAIEGDHQLEHLEADQFNVAALCAIGI